MATSYHILGIGGAGMSAIGHLLLDQGHQVSGCDPQSNALTAELAARGVEVRQGHDAAHIHGVDVVVMSSAVRADQLELLRAHALGLPVMKRADLWHTWSLEKPTLAVAGTHGKTTTTAMAALILSRLGHDPAYIVPAGGPVPGLDRFARWGTGPFVIEADEYDRLLLGLVPEVAVITSVDWDHVDIYPSREDVEATFAQFARQVRGTVVACAEDAGVGRVRAQLSGLAAGWQTYGFGAESAWRISDLRYADGRTHFRLDTPAGAERPETLTASLEVPGQHNVLNAAGAVAAVAQLGVAPRAALDVLAEYRGASRRFELKGEAEGVTFVDDYAHNPAKVAAALSAARLRYAGRRLVVYFQPHTFSRTAALLEPLAAAFEDADLVLVGNIYPSREQAADFPGIDAQLLAGRIPGRKAEAVGDIVDATGRLLEIVRPGDLVLTLGAGDGYQVGDQVRGTLAAGGVARES